MTDVHADAPAKDAARPVDRADLERVERRIDRTDGRIDRSEDRIGRAVEGIRADIGRVQESVDKLRRDAAEMRVDIGRVQESVDELRRDAAEVKKDVHALNKWKWAAGGIIGLAVVCSPVIAALILRGLSTG